MTGLKVEPLTSSIAARISGVRLDRLTDAGIEAVRSALYEYGVLVFSNQELTREQQVELGGRFGAVEGHPVRKFLGGEAEPLAVVENDEHKPPQDGQQFHVDYSFSSEVPDFAILRTEVVPPVGGDTIWSSAAAACARLSAPMKEFLSTLTATHDAGDKFWFEMRRTIGAENAARAQERFAGIDHPIIGTHPMNGRELLFVNPGYTVSVNGLSETESRGLLAMLFDHVNDPSFHYRHLWRPGDVVFWDELQTTHKGPNDFFPAVRRLTRVTVGTTAPARAA